MRKVWVALYVITGVSGGSVDVHAAPVVQVSVPNASRGHTVAQACAVCHGADGNSSSDIYPRLAGQHAGYLIKQLRDFKTPADGGQPARNSAIMTGIASALTDQQVVDVAAWFVAQSPHGGEAYERDTLALGQKIYRGGLAEKGVPACAGCHGPAGQGMPLLYPRLSGQWAEYTVAQLNAFTQGSGARNNSTPMHAIASYLSDSEIKAVANYISVLR